MPAIPNTLTGAAGEHLVAARLSLRGYSVGLTRGGSRAVDLLASNADGSRSLAIQVKTSATARVERKNPAESHWTFMLSTADMLHRDGVLVYVFVSLHGPTTEGADHFILPAAEVSRRLATKYATKQRKSPIRMLNLFDHEKSAFLNRWDLIDTALA